MCSTQILREIRQVKSEKNVSDRIARRYIGVALSGHPPQGEKHIFSERWFQNGGIPN